MAATTRANPSPASESAPLPTTTATPPMQTRSPRNVQNPKDSKRMSKTIELKVPDIGDFHDVPVIEVLVKAGDRIEKDQSLVTLESAKATMEVPASAAGVIKEVKVKVGDNVEQGAVIATVETEGEADAGAAPPSPTGRGAGGEGSGLAQPSTGTSPAPTKSEPSPAPSGHPLPEGEGKSAAPQAASETGRKPDMECA